MSDTPKIQNPDDGVWETTEYTDVYQPVVYGQREDRYLVSASFLTFDRQNLEGRLLTLAEAITDDRERREAIKSLIRNEMWKNTLRLLKVKRVK